MAHTVAFLVDQKQDFYVSLAWSWLLRERGADCETLVLLTQGQILPEFEPHLGGFDRVEVTDAPSPPRSLRMVAGMIVLIYRFRRSVRGLGLTARDSVVVYSAQALVATALIRVTRCRPRFVRIRQCNQEIERGLVRRRLRMSFYLNVWNRAVGAGPMRYRWLPSSDRVGSGAFIRDPYDEDFCLTAASQAVPEQRRIAWPFPVLRPASEGLSTPTLVFLGEVYPFVEGQTLDELRPIVQSMLDRVRELHPAYRLVFKPRSHRSGSDLGLELDGWERGDAETLLESMLIDDPSVEKVVSFKSSGSIVASQYGCAAYLLYPVLPLPPDFRAHLDGYFAAYRDAVTFVEQIDEMVGPSVASSASPERTITLTKPLIDLLEAPSSP